VSANSLGKSHNTISLELGLASFFTPFCQHTSMKNPIRSADYYSEQYNARASIPEHPYIFTRWVEQSAQVRRRHAGLFDLMYGESAGERLDLFPTRVTNAPLLVFIHGGWWRSLDKSDFSSLAPVYTNAGINVAMLNYSLAPEVRIEEIVQQQLRALTWLYKNAERYEIDAERIILVGHSAGAQIKLPPAKPEVYCWSASKALVNRDPPKGGYSPNFI
jgi:arylformamidase